MTARKFLALALAAALVPVLAIGSPAYAAGAATGTTATAAPKAAASRPAATFARTDVQIWPQSGNGSVLLVVGTIATTTPLPAVVSLPVPKGAKVTWIGELDPSPKAKDIELRPTVKQVAGGSVIEVTATKYREIQYEADLPLPSVAGQRYALAFDWVQAVPSGTVQFAWKTPAAAYEVRTKPAFKGKPDTNSAGDQLFLAAPVTLPVGTVQPVTIDYLPQPAGSQDLPVVAGSRDYTMPILLGLLAVAIAGLAFVLVSQKRTAAAAVEGEEGEEWVDEDADGADAEDSSEDPEPEEQEDVSDDAWAEDEEPREESEQDDPERP